MEKILMFLRQNLFLYRYVFVCMFFIFTPVIWYPLSQDLGEPTWVNLLLGEKLVKRVQYNWSRDQLNFSLEHIKLLF